MDLKNTSAFDSNWFTGQQKNKCFFMYYIIFVWFRALEFKYFNQIIISFLFLFAMYYFIYYITISFSFIYKKGNIHCMPQCICKIKFQSFSTSIEYINE